MTQRMEGDAWGGRLASLAALTRFDALAIVLSSREGQSTYAAHNLPAVAWANTPAGTTIANVVAQRTPESLGAVGLPLGDGRSAETLEAAPIVWKEQSVGALVGLAARGTGDAERAALVHAAELIAIELADANVLWRAQRQAQDLDARVRASRDLQRSLRMHDARSLLDRAVAQLAELFSADGVSIMLLDDSGRLAVCSARGLSEEAKRERRAIGEGISGRVAQTGQAAPLTGAVTGGSAPAAPESLVAPPRARERAPGPGPLPNRLFGEDQGPYVVACADPAEVLNRAETAGVAAAAIGRTGGAALTVSGHPPISLDEVRDAYEGWLPGYMASP